MGGHHIATPNPTSNPNPKPHPNPNPNPDQVWAGDPGNMVLVPGYCVQGTLGAKVQSGAKQVEVEGRSLPVRCKVSHATLTPTPILTITLTLTRSASISPSRCRYRCSHSLGRAPPYWATTTSTARVPSPSTRRQGHSKGSHSKCSHSKGSHSK